MRSRKFLKAEQARLAWDAPGLMAGVDEAGRGPLAGPVVAAAVILDDQRPIRGLADSKTLTALQRERLNEQILAKALCCSVAQASVEEIDTHNILQATMLAMRRAVEGLRLKPAKVLVDGNRLPTLDVLAEAIVERRRAGEGDLGRVDPGQGAPRPAVRSSCTPSSRTTALPATRATARPSTWRRCCAMAPACTTGDPSARSRRCLARAPGRDRADHGGGAERHGRRSDAGRGADRAMTAADVSHITSRDNPLLKELRKLAHDPGAYRKPGRVWLEGDHLCRAARERGVRPAVAVFAESLWPSARHEWAGAAGKTVVMADALLAGVSGLESPAPMGFVLDLPARRAVAPAAPTVVLDRLQDAGNVGSILRSAAAFGFTQVIALKGTAALWAPKVLRAGMGAHFGLRLIEGVEAEALDALAVPCIATSSHRGDWLHRTQLPYPVRLADGPRRAGRFRRPGGARGPARAHRAAGRRGVAQRRGGGGDLPACERRRRPDR